MKNQDYERWEETERVLHRCHDALEEQYKLEAEQLEGQEA